MKKEREKKGMVFRLTVVFLTHLVYVLAFPFLYGLFGGIVPAMGLIPAVVAGRLLGPVIGFTGGVGMILENWMLVVLVGGDPSVTLLTASGMVGSAIIIMMATGVGFVGSLNDKLNKQIKISSELERRVKLILANSPLVLFSVNNEGIFTLSEGSGLEKLGLKRGEVVGKSVLDVYGEAPEVVENIRRALGGEAFGNRVSVGGLVFDVYYAPIKLDDGGVSGVVGVANDVTEEVGVQVNLRNKAIELEKHRRAMMNLLEDQKELERQLKIEKEGVEQKVVERTKELSESQSKVSEGWLQIQREKAKLMASIDSLPLGMFMVDLSHEVLINNEALRQILELDNEKVSFETVMEKLKGGGVTLKHVCADCRGDGKNYESGEVKYGEKILKIVSVPVKDKEELIGTAVVVEDITEAKMLERSKEEFFSIASHELRTPLTAIRGNAALIQEYHADVLKGNADLAEMVGDMHVSSLRLIKIVNDFLDTSRLEQNRMQFKPQKVALVEMVKKVVDDLEKLAEEKGLQLKLKVSEGESQVWSDPERTEQVLINLIGNSIKYTNEGQIDVSVGKVVEGVEVLIKDTGVGIADDKKSLLFHKFQQAGEKILARDVTQGTGMGLYISKLMAEGMKGKVELVESELGKGSTFRLILPAAGGEDKVMKFQGEQQNNEPAPTAPKG